ncbi:MAG: response regulator [Candidatus Aminicenantales bacterium]
MPEKRIVIVDDDENIRKTFSLLLGKKYRVYPVKDSEEALAKFHSAKVDLVIADYKLPCLNGMELIKRLRASGFEGEAMLISAHPDLVKIEDLSRLSISHFFVKPLDLDVLNLSIDRVLQPKKLLESHA